MTKGGEKTQGQRGTGKVPPSSTGQEGSQKGYSKN